MKVRAAVFEAPTPGGQTSKSIIEELDLADDLLDKEILVRVVACAVCHADLAARDGKLPFPLPGVLGHEGTGVVERVGAKVTQIHVGDHVIMSFPNDGICGSCLEGRPRWCDRSSDLMWSGRRYDGSPTALHRDGQNISSHLFQQSAFSTRVIATEMNVVAVSKLLPLQDLVLGCGIMTGAGGVLNTLRPEPGTSIAIFGAGGVGSAAIMAAKIAGCKNIFVIEPRPNRAQIAMELGATKVLDVAPDVGKQVLEESRGGVDYSMVCVGNAEAITFAVEALCIGGSCGVIGDPGIGGRANFSIPDLVGSSKTIRGINGGDGTAQTFIPSLIDLHQRGLLPLEKITQTYSLDSLDQAFLDAEEGRVVKPVIVMDNF